MGKKSKGSGNLGKALIRDRFGPSRIRRGIGGTSMLHSAEINDGYDWGRLNLQSVTEESSFQEFLSTAELAGTEFQAEKLNIKYVNPKSGIGLLSKSEKEKLLEEQETNKSFLKIPRRPKWDESTTAEELQAQEKEHFLEWRRQLAMLQEVKGLMLTPYEKNLEFWRQLWRVVERSDVVVQIVDARNPLLFRCEDLECYVKEVGLNKMNIILINKADFLTQAQREAWAKYFSDINVRVAFFSATLAAEQEKFETDERAREEDKRGNENDENNETHEPKDILSSTNKVSNEDVKNEAANDPDEQCVDRFQNVKVGNMQDLRDSINEIKAQIAETDNVRDIVNSSELLTRDQLVSLLKSVYNGKTFTEGVTTIGLVGYPNVGKSSTINALLKNKKVSVSATPGKTKHFQTLYVDADLLLCDCPGLVMPSFVCTKADMVLNGILPIDQMRDHVPSITLLGTLIPRHVIEDLYGIMLPRPTEGEDPDRPPTSEEILNAYAYNRGFMTQNGQPDNPRAARYLLKHFVNGKLLYCVAPPTLKQEEFHMFPPRRRTLPLDTQVPPNTIRATKGSKLTSDDLDKMFFQHGIPNVHTKGKFGKSHGVPQQHTNSHAGSAVGSTQNLLTEEKPWKNINKHANKKKREKSRRLYAHLDRH